jgi:hypothetical protein
MFWPIEVFIETTNFFLIMDKRINILVKFFKGKDYQSQGLSCGTMPLRNGEEAEEPGKLVQPGMNSLDISSLLY